MLEWRRIQKENFTNMEQLGQFLGLPLSQTPSFPLNLPRRLAQKIEKETFDDPILKQFLPTEKEQHPPLSFLEDPVSDQSFQKTERLLQKYRGRALLLTTGACAMHCRYCFRQNYPYSSAERFEAALQEIREDQSIREVILSGGDPLSLSDKALGELIDQLEAIPHVKLLRFHTRFPIGIPERITKTFLDMLDQTSLQVIFVVHVNHPRELDSAIFAALKQVGKLGIPLLCQSVLLAGVNDAIDTLEALCLSLVQGGIVPYYLHQLDPIKEGHHFEVPIRRGLELIEELREKLPGYALPRYVQEVPFKSSKTPLTSGPLPLTSGPSS